MTTPKQASEFVLRTGVDVLAPAIGTMHGMLKSMVAGETRKHVDPGRIAAIKHAVRKPLTLHGGSGTNDQDVLDAIEGGITIIHINTGTAGCVAPRIGVSPGEEAGRSGPLQAAGCRRLPVFIRSFKYLFFLHNMARSTLSETRRLFKSSRWHGTVHPPTAGWGALAGIGVCQFQAFASCKSA